MRKPTCCLFTARFTALIWLARAGCFRGFFQVKEAPAGEEFSGRHGDWGRDAALWLGRRQGRLKLAELGQSVGGMDYATVGKAIIRFARGWKKTRLCAVK